MIRIFRRPSAVALTACLLLEAAAALADTSLSGTVSAVLDGDSIIVVDAGRREVEVRLAQIDAPEHGQADWQASRQSLSELLLGRTVTVERVDADRYGRIVGRVWEEGTDAGLEQVRRGMAWVYRWYTADQAYFRAEERARQEKKGLWSQPRPVPPWRFRHRAASSDSESSDSDPRRSPADRVSPCGAKHRCAEMLSCEEARFYLVRCGVKSLDRDGDGTPCEELC
ncbi:thermonuclease family protein [Methylococcus capsulatus]|uniref:Micrococcal nuclease n=1 Tax=Methylococcus capsulatus TaxID=414 RepID=A0AA35UT41_METCP|nr:thermonuclease family protein [Methylococcus capsulatus]CAI8878820.1 micrococcal nuclease [Methylococcus capsulatus]